MGSNINNFDDLYKIICYKLKASSDLDLILEQIVQKSDYDCIKLILSHDSEAVTLFRENIVPHFDIKDEEKSQQLLKEACTQNSLEQINNSLRLCHKSDTKVDFIISDILNPNNLQNFIKISLESLENNLISEIFSKRAAILFQKGEFDSSIRDTFRSASFGGHKTYEIVLRLALSYKHLGHLIEAKLVAQHALEVLRSSSQLDNEAKSKETVRLVAIMKEIKNGSGKSGDKVESHDLKLFEDRDEKLLSSSSALELKYSVVQGRHVIARKSIPAGSTIIVEEPFAWSVNVNKYPSTCQFCMKLEPDCLSCDQCSAVIFCNEECKSKAMSQFHNYECSIMKLLDCSKKLGQMALLCFRTIVKVPLKDILQCHESLEKQEILMGYNKEGKLDSADYTSVFAQTTNSSRRSSADLLKRTYSSIFITLCLRFVGYFRNTETLEIFTESEEIVASVVLRHLQSLSCNAYGVNQASQGGIRGLEIEEVGGATYPMISTTNHNCSPNIYRFNIGKKCVVNTLCQINEGEEIYDSYGPTFTTSCLKQRKKGLQNQYLFECGCSPCLNNWQGFEVLKNSLRLFSCPYCNKGQISCKDKRKCSECGKLVADFKKLEKHLKHLEDKYLRAKEHVLKERLEGYEGMQNCICLYIQTVQKLLVAPNKEMVEAQEVLKLLWNIAVKNNVLI